MKSPIRFFVFCAIFCILIGLLLNLSNPGIRESVDSSVGNLLNNNNLDLARFYRSTGRFEDALREYEAMIAKLPPSDVALARNEMSNLIFFQSTPSGQLYLILAYASWLLPIRLYILGAFFILLAIIILIARVVKRPTLVFLAFRDYAELGITNLSQALTDRIREVVWRIGNQDANASLITENLDVPIMGMISEGVSYDAISAIETAFIFSTGVSNLPLSNLLTSLFIWLEQPKYLVRGEIEKTDGNIYLKVILIDNSKSVVEKSWNYEMPETSPHSEIINAIIYPLLFYFNHELQAGNWEALRELHSGIEEFFLFREQNYSLNHLKKAQDHVERALQFDPNYEMAKYDLGLFLLQAGDYEGARKCFRDISSSTIDQTLRRWASYHYGVALFQSSQDWAYKQADDLFQKLLDEEFAGSQEEKEINLLIRSTLSNLKAKMAMRQQGRIRSNLIRQAIEEADRVLKIKSASAESRVSALIGQGYAYLAGQDYTEAVSAFSTALNINPHNITGWLGIGEVYLSQGAHEQTVSAFQTAARLSPLSGYANYRLGNIYREAGNTDMAVIHYKRAPQLGLARIALGKIYLSNGDLVEALEEFRSAVKINSRLSEGWVNIAWTILELEDDTLMREAEDAARRAVQLEKIENQKWHRYAILSRCLLQAGKYDSAHKAALKATELNSEKAQAFYYLAQAQNQLGLYQQSKESVKKILALEGAKGEWYRLAIDICSNKNHSEKLESSMSN